MSACASTLWIFFAVLIHMIPSIRECTPPLYVVYQRENVACHGQDYQEKRQRLIGSVWISMIAKTGKMIQVKACLIVILSLR